MKVSISVTLLLLIATVVLGDDDDQPSDDAGEDVESITITPDPGDRITISPITGRPPITVGPVRPPITIGPFRPPITVGPVRPPITIGPFRPPITVGPVRPPITVGPVRPPITVGPSGPAEDLPPLDGDDLGMYLMDEGFHNFTKKPVSIYTLIKNYLRVTAGAARFQLLRLIDIMDSDSDYYITNPEFVEIFGPAASDPVDAIRTIFQLYDLDENHIITKYEWAQVLMLQSETEIPMIDIWVQTSQEFHNRDFNSDGVVEENEFVMNELFEIAYAIGNDIEEDAESQPSA